MIVPVFSNTAPGASAASGLNSTPTEDVPVLVIVPAFVTPWDVDPSEYIPVELLPIVIVPVFVRILSAVP